MAKSVRSDALEFEFEGAPWLVAQWTSFSQFFNLGADEVPAFYLWLKRSQKGSADIVRMLYGIRPVVADGDERFSRVWSLDEVAHECHTNSDQIRLILSMARQGWGDERRHNPPPKEPPKPVEKPQPAPERQQGRRPKQPAPGPQAQQAPPPEELQYLPPAIPIGDEHLAVLNAYGFGSDIFDLQGRSTHTREAEIEWFVARLEELKRVFEEPMAKTLARQAVLNELSMRRLDDQIMRTPPASESFWNLQESKRKIEATYLTQWQQLEASCPFIKSMQTKAAFAGVVSEFIDAYRLYKSDRNNELVDGLFTAMEIQILLRASQQDPNVRYRPELSLAWNEAKRCLWDAKFRSQFEDPKKPGTYPYLGLLAAGFQGAAANFMEKTGLKLPDLESDGPDGEFPKLFIPEHLDEPPADELPQDREIVIPEKAVEIANK